MTGRTSGEGEKGDMENDKAANAAITKALIKVQQHVLKASKDGKKPMFNSRYATLDSVLDTVREPLEANGEVN